jgi:DNA-directed RNA polymerase alpha subunit
MLKEKISSELYNLDSNTKTEALQFVETLSDKDLFTINSLVNKYEDESDLFKLLGSESGAGAIGQNLKDAGTKVFLNIITKVQLNVCSINALKQYTISTDVVDTFTVAALIAGGLTGKMTEGVNIPLIAVIISRMGARNLCQKVWDKSKK